MNESYMIVLKGREVYAGDYVRKGRTKMRFRCVVFDVDGDYVEIVDASGRISKCSPAELKPL